MIGKEGRVMKRISIFVLAVLLLAPMSINAAESDETKETIEALPNDVTGTWNAINSGLTNTHVYTLAIDPSNTNIIYTGTDGGVFKSTDGGVSWNAINSGLTNTHVYTLAIDPLNTNIIYTGTDGGVFRSTDGGEHWSAGGLPSAVNILAIAIDPSSTDMVYAATNVGVFISSVEGGSWNNYNPPYGSYATYALVIDPSDPSIFYISTNLRGDGVFKFTGWGITTTSTCLGSSHAYALAIDPTNPGFIYAGTDGGVIRSTDGGDSCSAISSGLTNTNVVALAIDPLTPSIIYGGTDDGVYKSTDKGVSWSDISSGLTNTNVIALAIDPLTPSIIYAGTWGGGVFKSSPAEGPPSLHISKSGTGDGSVTSNPSGIDCGSTCTGTYNQGTSVTLTATPSSGSVFAGWSGACSGTGDCVVTMDSHKSVTATFNLQTPYSLTVVKAGKGDGTVTSSPAGISCGSACSEAFQKVAKVKLTAKANPDSIFAGWSGGGYSGTKPCQVTVDSDITITASFDKKVPHISVSPNSLEFGSVKVGRSLKKTLKIMNNGTGDLSVSIGGVGGTDFSVAGSTNITVKPKRSYNLGVTFKPTSAGDKTATLGLNSNDPDVTTISISLTGTGI
jgi:photosystem II stability/assembly factor-like uncharacterized protein